MVGHTTKIQCNIDSYPAVDAFTWSFNNSKEDKHVRKEDYTFNGTTSTLRYNAKSDHDFGHLFCWAANSKGMMPEPCVFQIIPAGKCL